jgi:hypothetical protein
MHVPANIPLLVTCHDFAIKPVMGVSVYFVFVHRDRTSGDAWKYAWRNLQASTLYQFHNMLILQASAPEPPMLILIPVLDADAAVAVAVPVVDMDMLIVEVPMFMELDPISIFGNPSSRLVVCCAVARYYFDGNWGEAESEILSGK